MTTLPTALRYTIADRPSAEAWIRALHAADLVFHFEDDPGDIINGHKGEPLFAPEDVPLIRERIAALYAQKWGRHECPIGFSLYLETEGDLAAWAYSHNTSIIVADALFNGFTGSTPEERERIWTAPTPNEKATMDLRVLQSDMTIREAANIAAHASDINAACYAMITFCDMSDGGAWGDAFADHQLAYIRGTSWDKMEWHVRADFISQSARQEVEFNVEHEAEPIKRADASALAAKYGYRLPEIRKHYPGQPSAQFSEWWAKAEREANESEEGRLLRPLGFYFKHTGGNCTAWEFEHARTGLTIIAVNEGEGRSPVSDPYWQVCVSGNGQDFSESEHEPLNVLVAALIRLQLCVA